MVNIMEIGCNYSNTMTERNYISSMAKVTFFVYLFVIFFGTGMPFQPKVTDIEDMGTSNIVNQIVFTALFLVSCFCLYSKRSELLLLIKREKYLTLFLVWCVLSVFWSNYPFVSFKRWFSLLASVTTIWAFLLHTRSSEEILGYFKVILFLYISTNLFSVLFIPGAIDPRHFTWRGIAVSKNFFGQAAVVCIILCAYMMKKGHLSSKFVFFWLLVLSVVLLFGAKSMTSILTFVVVLFLYMLVSMDRLFERLRIGKSFSFLIILTSILLLVMIMYLGRDIIEEGFSRLGRDLTFTGRTELWFDLLGIARNHLFFGYGYGGFWVIDRANTDLMVLYEKYIWLPNEAHSGYLEIIKLLSYLPFFKSDQAQMIYIV